MHKNVMSMFPSFTFFFLLDVQYKNRLLIPIGRYIQNEFGLLIGDRAGKIQNQSASKPERHCNLHPGLILLTEQGVCVQHEATMISECVSPHTVTRHSLTQVPGLDGQGSG